MAPPMEYLDFVLLIAAGREQPYTLHLLESPGGEDPGRPLALDAAAPRIAGLLAAVRRHPPSPAAARELGQALFDALFAVPEVYACYHTSLSRVGDQGKGLRLRLRCQLPELAALPWELLFDSRLRREHLCLSRETPLVRHVELALPLEIEPLQLTPPIRILGMTGFSRGLAAREEKEQMATAIELAIDRGLVELAWVPRSGWRDLEAALRQGPWHVFHFIGHGEFDPAENEGFLLFDAAPPGKEPRPRPVPARDLAMLLADTPGLRLAVINACKGGMAAGPDLLSSLGAVLASRGIPAVLSMQQEISDRAALELSRAFYNRLADGEPVDAALAAARQGIKLALGDTAEWATPVLHLRSRSGEILRFGYPRTRFAAGTAGTEIPAVRRPVPPPAPAARKDLEVLHRQVWQSWIEGFLARALAQMPRLELGQEVLAGMVDSPWGNVLAVPGSFRRMFEEAGSSLLLLGEPGSGKTVTLLELARDLLLAREADPDLPVPVVFPLSSWAAGRRPLLDWMAGELAAKAYIPWKFGRGWLEEGWLLPLLDGLDEVQADAREACVEAINAYLDRPVPAGLAVSCRLREYLALPSPLRLNGALRLLPLREDQVWAYIRSGGGRLAALGLLLERDSGLRLEARSPLMLGLMTRTYEGLPPDEIVHADARSLAARRRALMEAYVLRMYQRAGLRGADA